MKHHPRNSLKTWEPDIARQSIIVMVRRNGAMIVPKGDLIQI